MPAAAGKVDAKPVLAEKAGCGGGGAAKWAPPALPPAFDSVDSAQVSVKKVLLIYNPVSGKKLAKKLVDRFVVPQLTAAGVEVDARPTERAGHGAEMAQTLPLEGVDAIVAIGGDGTLSEVVNGYMRREVPGMCPLGFIPGGTGNSVCTDLGMPKANEQFVSEAVKRIVAGRTKKVDLQRIQGSAANGTAVPVAWSFNIVAWGLGTDANAAAEGMRWMGPARYDVAILQQILKFKRRRATITVDDGVPMELDPCMLACLQNNKHTGAGLCCAPLAQLDDGLLDLWFGAPRSRAAAIEIDGQIKGGGKHIYNQAVNYHRCRKVKLETPQPTRYMVDGDLRDFTPVQIEVVPGAISVFY